MPPRTTDRKPLSTMTKVRLALFVVGGLFLIAILFDVRKRVDTIAGKAPPTITEELKAVVLGLIDDPYVEPRGRFSIVAPAGWRVATGAKSSPYDVTFFSLNGASMQILVSTVGYNDLRDLSAAIREREKAAGITTVMDIVELGGHRMIRRSADLVESTIVTYDFVQDFSAVHILCSAPRAHAKAYAPVFADLAATFRFLPPPATAAEPVSAGADGSELSP